MRRKNILVLLQLLLLLLIVLAAVKEIAGDKRVDLSQPGTWLTVNLLTAILGLLGFLAQLEIRSIDQKYSLGAMLTEGYLQNFLLKVPEKLEADPAAKNFRYLFVYIPQDICSTEKRNNRDTVKATVGADHYTISDTAPRDTPENRFRLDSFTAGNHQYFIDYADTLSSLRAWVDENCPKKDGVKLEDEEKNRFGNRYIKEFRDRLAMDIPKHQVLEKVRIVRNAEELRQALG